MQLKNVLTPLLFLALGLPVTAQISETVNNVDWNSAAWGTPAAAPTSGNTYITVPGLTGTTADPIGVNYSTTLRANDNSGTTTFGGASLEIAGTTRLLMKQSGDTASATLILDNNSNTVFANGTASGILAGTIQVGHAVTDNVYLGINSSGAATLTVSSALTGAGILNLGSSLGANTVNLTGNINAFTGNITIYTAGTFSIGSNAVLSHSTLIITNTNCTFALNNVITLGSVKVGTVTVANGSYTAAQLNTATGTNVFTGTGTIFVGTTATSPVQVTDGRVTVSMYPSGIYQVASSITGWTFGGYLPSPTTQLTTTTGTDSIGSYQQIAFSWLDASSRQMTGTMNLYAGQDSVVFSDTLVAASATAPSPFPNFTTIPQNLSLFSYTNNDFAPPSFSVATGSAPWMLFDSNAHAMIISPASHFVPASLSGDGKSQIASGFNSNLVNPPAGLTQKTIMSMSAGINHTFNIWGLALTNLYSKVRPAYDADTLLRYYGYWTDNGANYYYSYNTSATESGANAYETPYEATLQNLVANFTQAGIPIHYMQLDSWWYDKSNVSYNGGNAGGYHGGVPQQPWALFGGELSWAADGYLFPTGLHAFSQSLAMSFVCHARWVDTTSTETGNSSPNDPTFYTQFGGYSSANFSGIAGISSTYWNSLASYAAANGINTYEQDWLEEIVTNSPAFTSTTNVGDSFFGNMSAAFAAQGVDIQYCIPLASSLLQGSEYGNIETTRASGDRFQSSRYHDFMYTSRFAASMGIWPWSDLCMSTETQNLLLSTLSAGPVGTGDSQGNESASNLFLTIRADGVIVKPDAPLVPTDGAFIAESAATGAPLIASTTSNNGVTTTYATAIQQSGSSTTTFSLSMSDLGITSPAYFYNYFSQSATKVQPGGTLSGQQIASGGVSYYIIAPVGQSGIAFMGDLGKFVSNGRKRIASVTDQTAQLTADVLFAPTESQVTLHGYSSAQPVVTVQSGTASAVSYNSTTGHFTVAITVTPGTPLNNNIDPARDVIVTFNIPTSPTFTSSPATAMGTTGTPYTFTFQASGYPPPTFSLTSGTLPPGLTLSSTGVLSGSPTLAGTYSGTVSASNNVGNPVTQNFTITITSNTSDSPTMSPWGLGLLAVLLMFIATKFLPQPLPASSGKFHSLP